MSSVKSLDTAKSGSGDHENYYVQLNLTEYLIIHKNGSMLNAACESKAVRIRSISEQRLWPNIPRTTLIFSSKSTVYVADYNFHKKVKPKYG